MGLELVSLHNDNTEMACSAATREGRMNESLYVLAELIYQQILQEVAEIGSCEGTVTKNLWSHLSRQLAIAINFI